MDSDHSSIRVMCAMTARPAGRRDSEKPAGGHWQPEPRPGPPGLGEYIQRYVTPVPSGIASALSLRLARGPGGPSPTDRGPAGLGHRPHV